MGAYRRAGRGGLGRPRGVIVVPMQQSEPDAQSRSVSRAVFTLGSWHRRSCRGTTVGCLGDTHGSHGTSGGCYAPWEDRHRSQSYLRATPSVTTIRTPWRCLSPLFQGRIVLLFGILF